MGRIEIYSTCPTSKDADQHTYLQRVVDVARWSEQAGCSGILVYTDNSLVDPWLVSQLIIQNTELISPLVAVQPVYMHPYTVAKMVSSLGFLYGRRLCLNMVAGGFRNDLLAMGDETPHDDRYARLVEYTQIITGLLQNKQSGLTYDGKYYRVKNLKMMPSLPEELQPPLMISGSSDAGFEAARATGATAIKYPKPPGEESGPGDEESVECGVRIGIVARNTSAAAWSEANRRFPVERKGELAHQLAMKTSDSHWHQQLSAHAAGNDDENPYWLIPFQNYKTFCPYLVGSYRRVAEEIATYIAVGYRTFVLDIPPDERELEHIGEVFRLAVECRSK